MLFRRSATTTRAHQEKAIRRRKSGRNRLQADRHRRRTGQAGREDFAKSCLSGCSAQECRDRRSLRGSRGAGRQWRPQKAQPFEAPTEPTGETSPCPVDVMMCVISYWVLSGAQQAADLQLCCTALPLSPRTAFSAYPQKGEMVAETDPTQWPRWKARHL